MHGMNNLYWLITLHSQLIDTSKWEKPRGISSCIVENQLGVWGGGVTQHETCYAGHN